MIPNSFSAFVINKAPDGQVGGAFTELSLTDLDDGEVTIRVHYSSINYKDALAATGAGKIIRRFPCVGGIDLAGEVIDSTDKRFKPGDAVLANSFDIGVSHHGGYAQLARIPAKWVVRVPPSLSLLESMALGCAGFTAALSIMRMEHNGLTPDRGPVVVTGATGGVGSLAINMLAGLGYEVVALTGKPSEQDYLKNLGASAVKLTSTIDHAQVRPLEGGLWAGAVDNVGGPILHWLLATMMQAGTVASIGNAASATLETSVFPFILRGVSLLGIDSGYMPFPTRQHAWDRLATDLRPANLMDITRVINFDALPMAFDQFVQGQVKGRTVVKIIE
ncbi:oxidoreductase [Cupriavidus pauculus]|uniref:Oxidoreductase n=1 Tax=Cupriavidus pauculus TaxID=82633 RepID=A0A2N5C3B1_9BURK|nr:oxidoreductase [Cupriavidus pauculus]PLP96713.1 oxidoreductase [Cupriavidus pauculus]